MEKTSDKLSHLQRSARGSRDVAATKSEADLINEKRHHAKLRGARNKRAIEAGIDPEVVREVDPGSVPGEEPDQIMFENKHVHDMNQTPSTKMRKAELKAFYITSTLSPGDFFDKYLRPNESKLVWSRIAKNEKWDDQRISYYEDRIDNVVEHFKQDMEDVLEEHNQMHLQISKQIGLKIMQILPNMNKAVELQSCAVALKNIQSVSRLALGASTDNTALKGVDDFEEFLKGASAKKNNEVENVKDV